MTTAQTELLSQRIDRPVHLQLRGGEELVILPLFVLTDEQEVIYRVLSTTAPSRYENNREGQVYVTEFQFVESVRDIATPGGGGEGCGA